MVAELPAPEHVDVDALARECLDGKYDVVCVLGPTASGKTRYAVDLAHRMDEAFAHLCAGGVAPRCEIISADSRQVYRGMDIGTGKDLCEYGDVPYHMIDIRPAGDRYNVYEYQKDFADVYGDMRRRGAFPILCGGTGLYIEAATCAYDFHKDDPQVDPARLPRNTFYIGTLVSRELRVQRIDARLRARIEEGLVDEIRRLIDEGVDPQTLIFYGLEYKFVTRHVLGEISLEEMYTLLSNAIHQFAKRQMTWFRGMERRGIRIHWVEV